MIIEEEEVTINVSQKNQKHLVLVLAQLILHTYMEPSMTWGEMYHHQVFQTIIMMFLVQSAILPPERLSS